jgi:hypothetical protein
MAREENYKAGVRTPHPFGRLGASSAITFATIVLVAAYVKYKRIGLGQEL